MSEKNESLFVIQDGAHVFDVSGFLCWLHSFSGDFLTYVYYTFPKTIFEYINSKLDTVAPKITELCCAISNPLPTSHFKILNCFRCLLQNVFFYFKEDDCIEGKWG